MLEQRRWLAILVLVAWGAVLVAPIANMVHPFFNEPFLYGVSPPIDRPGLTLRGVRTEAYQHSFIIWFEKTWGLRRSATRLDNSLSLWLFGETPRDHHVQVGKNNVLFLDEQIHYPRRRDTRGAADALARLIRLAQDAYNTPTRTLAVILAPSKVVFYRDEFPPGWMPAAPYPNDTQLYESFRDAVKRHGANVIDGREIIPAELGHQRECIYSPLGRHWNGPVACRLLERAITTSHQELPAPDVDCSCSLIVDEQFKTDESELFNLMNVWGRLQAPRVPKPRTPPPEDQRPPFGRVLVAGSSFSWQFVWQAERNQLFSHVDLLFYNTTLTKRDPKAGESHRPMPSPVSEEWRHIVFDDRQFLFLVLNEDYIPYEGAELLIEIIKASGQRVDYGLKKPFLHILDHQDTTLRD